MSWAAFGVNAVVTLVVVWALLTATFAVALRVGRHAIIDVVWGSGFVVIALVSVLLARARGFGDPGRGWLVLALTAVWGVRLAVHIARRNAGKGEDPRYAEIQARAAGSPAAHMYRRVYLTQAAAMWFVSLPVQVAAYQRGPLWSGVSLVVTVAGIAVWTLGFGFEAVGDAQLSRFTADPANKGVVMDRGLWRYTRHPNYFGDACVWWGIWVAGGLASGWVAGLASVIAPVTMTVWLVWVTGARLLEKSMMQRPGYPEYAARTSMFFPLPPKR
jgi:steroid 5-alpha reductase family enzyme